LTPARHSVSLVAKPAGPFGGMDQSGLGHEGAHEDRMGVPRDAIRFGNVVGDWRLIQLTVMALALVLR
jgi:hypothetical protein